MDLKNIGTVQKVFFYSKDVSKENQGSICPEDLRTVSHIIYLINESENQ